MPIVIGDSKQMSDKAIKGLIDQNITFFVHTKNAPELAFEKSRMKTKESWFQHVTKLYESIKAKVH